MSMKPEMSCPEPEILIDLFYSELPPEEQAPLMQHLHVCPACSLEWRALEQSMSLVNELPGGEVQPSAALHASVMKAFEAEQPWWRRISSRLWERFASPVPTYKALLGGAALAMVIQILVPDSMPMESQVPAPRPPDPAAVSIKIEAQQVDYQEPSRETLKQTVDDLASADDVQVF